MLSLIGQLLTNDEFISYRSVLMTGAIHVWEVGNCLILNQAIVCTDWQWSPSVADFLSPTWRCGGLNIGASAFKTNTCHFVDVV